MLEHWPDIVQSEIYDALEGMAMRTPLPEYAGLILARGMESRHFEGPRALARATSLLCVSWCPPSSGSLARVSMKPASSACAAS